MKPLGALQWTALVARVTLGVWFVYTAGVKLWVGGLDRFTREIGNYQLVHEPLDAWVAYTVPWFEIVAGLCLVLGLWLRGALLTMGGLVLGFAVFVGWAWAHGLDIACGCSGSAEPMNYWGKAAEFALYAVVLAGLWWTEGRRQACPGQNLQNMA